MSNSASVRLVARAFWVAAVVVALIGLAPPAAMAVPPRTTAGVSAPQALSNPESVPPAYPNAQVFRYGDGHLREVLDNHLGIKVDWVPVLYTNEFSVTMFIFRPRA
jgi:hypothetical protein